MKWQGLNLHRFSCLLSKVIFDFISVHWFQWHDHDSVSGGRLKCRFSPFGTVSSWCWWTDQLRTKDMTPHKRTYCWRLLMTTAWCKPCSFSIETVSHISKYCPFPDGIIITSSGSSFSRELNCLSLMVSNRHLLVLRKGEIIDQTQISKLFLRSLYFQRSERINLFHYNINIACKHSNGLLQANWYHCIGWKIKVSQIGCKVNRKPTGIGGRITVFWNNRNTTALLATCSDVDQTLYGVWDNSDWGSTK